MERKFTSIRPESLDKARGYCEKHGLKLVEFVSRAVSDKVDACEKADRHSDSPAKQDS